MEYNLEKKNLNHYVIHLKLTQCCKSTVLQLKKNPQRKLQKKNRKNEVIFAENQ